jgi:hypothetical protein
VLTDKTTIKTTLGGAVAACVLVAGLHPWAVAQIRGVVRDEQQVAELQRKLDWERSVEMLRGDIRELRAEVRGLRLAIERKR